MIPVTLEQVADVVGGQLADPDDGPRRVDNVTIDSRTAGQGSLFVALPGEHADGHAYIHDAARRGAAGYLFDAAHGPLDPPGGIAVDEPADALLGLGAWVRATADPTVVAVTGSNGKTTTKDLIAAAVGAGRTTVASAESFNNELGVPLTCCAVGLETEVLVAEVGARGPGHIARLAPVLSPDVAVVTTVGASHLELLGTVEAVAAAKSELVASLDESGVAVLNIDDPRVAAMAQATPGRVVGYGRSAGADWRAEEVALDHLARPSFRVRGEPVRLPMPGAHNVGNALAALAVADVCGVSTASAAAALATASVSKWRMELGESPEGVVVFNDAYNANPDSAAVGLETLAAADVAGRRWAVLGEMAELGEGTAEAHAELGRRCAAGGVDGLVAVGGVAAELAEGAHTAGFAGAEGVEVVDNPDAALRVLSGRVGAGDAVLVKASRRSGLERVAAGLMNGLMAGKAEGGA